jgi:hypothetical protein
MFEYLLLNLFDFIIWFYLTIIYLIVPISEIIFGSVIKKNNYDFKCGNKNDDTTSIDDWLIIHGTTSICLTSLIIFFSLFSNKKKTFGNFCSFFFSYIFNLFSFFWIVFGYYIFFNMCNKTENLSLYLLVVLLSSYIAILNNLLTSRYNVNRNRSSVLPR